MEIKRIQENKLEITLATEDLLCLGITYESLDYVNPKTREAVKSILKTAKEETGFEPDNGKLLIEAYPLGGAGCVIYFTTLAKRGNPSSCDSTVFEFEDAELLLQGCCKLYRQYSHRIFRSSAWAMGGKYYLALQSLDSAEGVTSSFLLEFSRRVARGRLAEAYLGEHGQILAGDNAVDVFSFYFSKDV